MKGRPSVQLPITDYNANLTALTGSSVSAKWLQCTNAATNLVVDHLLGYVMLPNALTPNGSQATSAQAWTVTSEITIQFRGRIL